MSSDPNQSEVLDAVVSELSRFSKEVVGEVHRLRDQVAAEQQRVTALESEVQALRRTVASQHSTNAGSAVTLDATEPVAEPGSEPATVAPATAEVEPTPIATAQPAIQFAPITLSMPPLDSIAPRNPGPDPDTAERVDEASSDVPTFTWQPTTPAV